MRASLLSVHITVQSVQLDPERTRWTRDGLRVGLLGDQNDHCHPIDKSPRRGVFDVLVDGKPVWVRPGGVLPPPILIDGHLVAPIVRPPDDRLALDVDEADRPITRSWRPKPADLRCDHSTPSGLGIALDLELTAARTGQFTEPGSDSGGNSYGDSDPPSDSGSVHHAGLARGTLSVELLLQRAAREHVVPAELVPGPGAVGRLRADLSSEVLHPGENWMLSLRTQHGDGRLGVDLAVSAAGQPYARPSTAVTVLIVLTARHTTDQAYGRQVGDCIGSALDQSLPREHYEVLVVDQDCADGTAGLLDWLGTLHPRLRVLHLAPARDAESVVRRGLGAARGEFVSFLHPTERLTPNALRDLLAYARLHDADIVAGRTVCPDGRELQQPTFRRSRPYATIRSGELVQSLSADKLFRAALLDRHQLAFGSRPLDQQRFVAESYLLANRVAVFADRISRRSVANPDDGRVTAREHADGVGDAVTALAKHTTVDHGTRERFSRRWYQTEVLGRLRGEALLRLPPTERASWVRELASLAAEHFDPALARGLSPVDQIVARLLAVEAEGRASTELGEPGDQSQVSRPGQHMVASESSEPSQIGENTAHTVEALSALAEWERAIDARAEVRWVRPTQQGLQISIRVTLHGHGAPVFRPVQQNEASFVTLDPPLTATPPGTAPDPRAVNRHLSVARFDLQAQTPDGTRTTLRAHKRSVWFDASEFRVWAELSTLGVPGGRYQLDVRVRCCGWTRTSPVRANAAVLARQRRLHPPVPHIGYGPIVIDVPPHGGRPFAALCTDRQRFGMTSGLRTVLRTLGSP